MQQMNEFWEQAMSALPFVGVAGFGAALQSFKGRWRGWKNFFLSVLSAGFGAFIIGMAGQDMGLSPGWGYFLAGMIGYSGGTLVDEMLAATKARITGKRDDGKTA